MSFSQYSDYTVRMVSSLPNCPEQIILQEMQRATWDFCKETEAWIETLDPIDIVDGTDTYDISYSGDASILRVMSVKMKTGTDQYFDNISAIDPSTYEVIEDSQLRFIYGHIPEYSLADGMEVKVTVAPNLDALGIPVWLMNRYGVGIMAKCKFNLMMQPNKPWSNPQLAMLEYKVYQKQQGDFTYDKYVGRKNTNLVVQMRAF